MSIDQLAPGVRIEDLCPADLPRMSWSDFQVERPGTAQAVSREWIASMDVMDAELEELRRSDFHAYKDVICKEAERLTEMRREAMELAGFEMSGT